jgi:acetate kinase
MVRRYLGYVAMVLFLITAFSAARAQDQSRVNDKDLARLMQNVQDDAQPFRKSFDSALKKSTIRGTSQEKDARGLAASFEKQSKRALETFKKKRKAEDEVAAMVDTAGQIDKLVYSLNLNPATTQQWEKVRTELHQVAQAFNVPDNYRSRSGA